MIHLTKELHFLFKIYSSILPLNAGRKFSVKSFFCYNILCTEKISFLLKMTSLGVKANTHNPPGWKPSESEAKKQPATSKSAFTGYSHSALDLSALILEDSLQMTFKKISTKTKPPHTLIAEDVNTIYVSLNFP